MSIFNKLLKHYPINEQLYNGVFEHVKSLKRLSIEEFVEIDGAINFKLTENQLHVLSNMANHDRSIILLGKGSAKTTMVCILFRYLILQDLLKSELPMNRIDYANMCSTANSAREVFFREFTIQMSKSKIFNMIQDLYVNKKTECSILNDRIVVHSLNSKTSSFEGKNLKALVVDEISEPSFKDGITLFEDGSGSVFSRFPDGKAIALSWTRFPTANPLSDRGYFLYNKYVDDPDVFTYIGSTKEMRGFYPKDYKLNDPQKVKMYDCKFIMDTDTIIDVSTCNNGGTPIVEMAFKPDNEYINFDINVRRKPKYCFCHIDTSIKFDKTVIALYYTENSTPFIETHIIQPDHRRVSYLSLEDVIRRLKFCKVISFDRFNSEYFAQKFNCKVYSFAKQEQYDALMYFRNQLPLNIVNNFNEVLTEFNNVSIDHNKQEWTYHGRGSSDIVDAVIYSVFNSRNYQTRLTKTDKRVKTEVGFHMY